MRVERARLARLRTLDPCTEIWQKQQLSLARVADTRRNDHHHRYIHIARKQTHSAQTQKIIYNLIKPGSCATQTQCALATGTHARGVRARASRAANACAATLFYCNALARKTTPLAPIVVVVVSASCCCVRARAFHAYAFLS